MSNRMHTIAAAQSRIVSMFKHFSKGSSASSSAGSSKAMQALVNYHLKEQGSYMSAEDLLKTQDDDQLRNEKGEFIGLQKTDIIQFEAEGFDHWGMYIGVNCIAHLTNGFIRQSKLVDVAGGKPCRINNKVKSASRRELKVRPPLEIMQTVEKEMNKPVNQSALQFNSEHQVTNWKYGNAFSDTVDELLKDGGRAAGVLISGTGGVLLTAGVGGLAATPVGYKVGEKVAECAAFALNKNAAKTSITTL